MFIDDRADAVWIAFAHMRIDTGKYINYTPPLEFHDMFKEALPTALKIMKLEVRNINDN